MIGKKFSHYEILEKLGEGGMGEVYLAEDLKLRRKVALKFLPEAQVQDEEFRKRFGREARAAAKIEHPHIAAIYEIDDEGDQAFIVMEYVRGKRLRDAIKDGSLDTLALVEVALQIADALAKVHEGGLVHRDLKPDNILVSEEGSAKLIDFGLAKPLVPAFASGLDQNALNTVSTYDSYDGAVVGTWAYLSPEQARAESVDSRSDIFGFGIVLFEMLTGTNPFARENVMDTLSAILRDPPPPVRIARGKRSKRLQRIIQKALEKDPSRRYQSCRELASDLRDVANELSGRTAAPTTVFWRRVVPAMVLAGALLTGFWWFSERTPTADIAPEPVSVLVADFENRTGEAVFDGALEQAMAIGLEGASFVTAYGRADAHQRARQIDPASDGKLDERLAQLVCRSEGIKLAVTGTIDGEEGGYRISVRVLDSVTGELVAEATKTGVSKAGVLRAADELASGVRSELGERKTDTLDALAGETFVTASLEAMKAYAEAQELWTLGHYEEAISAYQKAISFDPEFGRAYSGLAVQLFNSGRSEEAGTWFDAALARIDHMTERGKYRTRGAYFLWNRDPVRAVQEFSALVDQYPADTAGYTNLAFAYFLQRDMGRAVEAGRRAVDVYPNNVLNRNNSALYAMYAGDFETSKREARTVLETNPSFTKAYVALALSQIATGLPDEADDSYQRLARDGGGARAASYASVGRADVALYKGELDAALAILEAGVAGDLANDNNSAAARKLAMLAATQLELGQIEQALENANRVKSMSEGSNDLFAVAQIHSRAGRASEVRDLASTLRERPQPDSQAFAELVEGELLLESGDTAGAIRAFERAREIEDTWLGRFDLGRAYIQAGSFAEAHFELEQCLKRRGEATAIFLDDVPTYHLFPPVHYYMGLAQEGLGSSGAVDSFRAYLDIRGASSKDELASDARRRIRANQS